MGGSLDGDGEEGIGVVSGFELGKLFVFEHFLSNESFLDFVTGHTY